MQPAPERTEIVRVDAAQGNAVLARAASLLRDGGLVAFPTETVYGLGANALNAEAVASIFKAKGRPSHNPLIVHVLNTDAAKELVTDWPAAAAKLAARFWPGPLTLVLPKCAQIPDIVTGGAPTVGVRVPAHPVALALLREAGVPIAAPSANRSNRLSPTRAEHVYADLEGRIPLILDGGPTQGGLESTVLDLTTTPPRLLRPGLLSSAEIETVVGPLARPERTAEGHASPVRTAASGGPQTPTPEQRPLPSPGMLSRHYAPRARLEIGPWGRVQDLLDQGERVGWLTFVTRDVPHPNLTTIQMPRDAIGYAAQLYAVLHALDAVGVTHIVVMHPPQEEAWLAIQDRLQRAAAPAVDAPENTPDAA